MSILEKAKYIKINYNDNNQIKKYINEYLTYFFLFFLKAIMLDFL